LATQLGKTQKKKEKVGSVFLSNSGERKKKKKSTPKTDKEGHQRTNQHPPNSAQSWKKENDPTPPQTTRGVRKRRK